MHITWKGQACFSITVSRSKQEQVRILTDPFDPSATGLKWAPQEADIVLVSHQHADHSNVKGVKGSPFVVETPGEFEVRDIVIRGIPSFHDDTKGAERGGNTIFVMEAEGMRLCHLGDIGQKELTAKQLELIGNIDVLFVPVGGTYTVDAKEAADIVNQVEPGVIIPMHYAIPGLKIKLAGVEEFLKVRGIKDTEPQAKLSLKVSEVRGGAEARTVVLIP